MTDQEGAPAGRHRAAIEERLAQARDRLAALTDLGATIRQASEHSNADDEHDPEGATIAWERAQTHALAEAARVDLAALSEALDRVDGGWDGRCARCGEQIPRGRLLARPATTSCFGCVPSRGR